MDKSGFRSFFVGMAAISLLVSDQAFGQELAPDHVTVAQVSQILDEDFVANLVEQRRLAWTIETIGKVTSDIAQRQDAALATDESLRLRERLKSKLGACIKKRGILKNGRIKADMIFQIKTAIAAELVKSDFEFIQSYYSTENGKRFKEFLLEDNQVSLSLWESVLSISAFSDGEVPRSPERQSELRWIGEVMSLSRPMQMFETQAQGDTGDLSAMAYMGFLNIAHMFHQENFRKLKNNYGGFLINFADFVNSQENKHLLLAMMNAVKNNNIKPETADIANFISIATRSGGVDCSASP